MNISCKELIRRDRYHLGQLARELGIDYDINLLISDFISVFESYEEKRARLRILGVKPKKPDSIESKKAKRVQIFSISKRKIKEQQLDINELRVKARLYTTLWKQLKLLSEVNFVEDNIITLEKQIQELNNSHEGEPTK